MWSNERKQQIIVAGFLTRDNEVLVVRSNKMLNPICDTEYYDIPAWELPFGEKPETFISNIFRDVFGIETNTAKLINATSYMHNGNNYQNVLITYLLDTKERFCNDFEDCENIHFLNKNDIDSYILSDRIKEVIMEGFDCI